MPTAPPRRPAGSRVLLVDNQDSYTYNLVHLIGELTGQPPVVVRNDRIPPVGEIARSFSHVVISPGPGDPTDPRWTGGCLPLIRSASVPVLGVCLGHQAVAVAFGGRVGPVPPCHGRISTVRHDGTGVLRDVPRRFPVVRYHSLAVIEASDDLVLTAFAEDGTVMALRHRTLPVHGVQFHPESVCAEYGERILATFLSTPEPRGAVTVRRSPRPTSLTASAAGRPADAGTARAELVVGEAPWRDPEDVFVACYAGRPGACWLDSGGPPGGLARWSYLGVPEGPHGHVVRWPEADGPVLLEADGRVRPVTGDVLAVLQLQLARRRVATDAPFDFAGGYVGYLGYESARRWLPARTRHRASTPDAAFAYLERFLAFDHVEKRVYAVAVAGPGERAEAAAWVDRTRAALERVGSAPPPAAGAEWSGVVSQVGFDRYRAAFARVQDHLHRGESYEVNLTFRLGFDCGADHAALYRHLRRRNPAPFAAYLDLPGMAVLSSSPERFLRIDRDGRVEARPIKGTAARAADPVVDAEAARRLACDPKTFAENLMVTDLLRNDLGQVCALGSVSVPQLMRVESYATVHQLVTTVTGRLAPGVHPLACVRAALPAGSMTGAPKLRTMEIIDEVEEDARGVYSGALGYLSLSGAVDLSVVIRTIVARGTAMSIGTGGGVVVLSDARDEYDEAMLKAQALLAAVSDACTDRYAPVG